MLPQSESDRLAPALFVADFLGHFGRALGIRCASCCPYCISPYSRFSSMNLCVSMLLHNTVCTMSSVQMLICL